MVKLTIMCPCYNEESTLVEVIEKLKQVDLGIDKEIIVVDDGSNDGSFDKLNKIQGIQLHQHVINRGKGAAMRTAVLRATGDILVPFDLDNEYDVNDLKVCLQPILEGKADVVYGSRNLNKSERKYGHLSFFLGGLALDLATRILYQTKITDEPTCLKMAKRELYLKFPIKYDRFDWEPEFTANILNSGIKIYEVPIHYYPRTKSEGKKIKWRDGVDALIVLLKLSTLFRQIIKFLITGGVAAIIALSITFFLTEFMSLHYQASYLVGIITGALFAYVVNKVWSFRSKEKPFFEAIRFGITNVIGWAINWGVTVLLTEKLAIWYLLSACFGTLFAALFTFTSYKWWVYKK